FSENAIILYNGQSVSGNGDFVSLTLKDGRVEFRYNLGSGVAVLQSRQKIDLGSDVTVIAKRHLRDGRLTVSGQKEVVGKSPGFMKSLDLGDHLYLGNVPESERKIYENIGVDSGFVGHLMKFKVGARNFDLRKVPLKSLLTRSKSKQNLLNETRDGSMYML
ncbi:Agrin-like protein, partial [Leptotrombidium deliense]